jgi:hypothetical protein
MMALKGVPMKNAFLDCSKIEYHIEIRSLKKAVESVAVVNLDLQ